MIPAVWLYTKDLTTIRVVQRDSDAASEVLVFGPDEARQHEVFQTPDAAAAFRKTMEAEIIANGFELAWSGGRGGRRMKAVF